MTYPTGQRRKGRQLPLHFCFVRATWNEHSVHHPKGEKSHLGVGHSSSGHHPCDSMLSLCSPPPLASPHQCSLVSVPDTLFIFLLNILPRLCLKMREKKKTSIFHLLNLLQRKQFSTVLKTQSMFQVSLKPPANCWAVIQNAKRDEINSHAYCCLDEIRLLCDILLSPWLKWHAVLRKNTLSLLASHTQRPHPLPLKEAY